MMAIKRITPSLIQLIRGGSAIFLCCAAVLSFAAGASDVDAKRLINANQEPGNWMTHGRTYDEQRYSPIDQINDKNVSRLGLDWFYDFETKRGLEATPLVVDGKMYVTGSWSRVYALKADTGELLWQYDPKVPPEWAVNACCGVVNRGVAVWQGKVYFGTLDGRLEALDAATGKLVWSTRTTPLDKPYTITGAPRVVKGKVIIGNGGAEMGVRGYVSAYDVNDGSLVWRFYTVPGNPDKPFESKALEMAAKTWKGGKWWELGGGGTVWDSLSYDPELDLLYVGVGNGSPWSRKLRSPGGGDNLFLSSIVAVRPDTGEYVWHYQTSPGDSWDYTATQQMILTELMIDGKRRKVIMQAPKNGFFYVLDRVTGEFISAEPFVEVTWASHVDPDTGRPAVHPDAYYESAPFVSRPSPVGAHTWHSMSFHPKTGLVYIPALESDFPYILDANFQARPLGVNLGVDTGKVIWPEDPAARKAMKAAMKGRLVAWDPVKQSLAWEVVHKVPWNGGTLATAGNLVFQGNGRGDFVAYSADSGQQLWSSHAQTGIVAAPISYTVNGEQYIALLAGWGGTLPLILGEAVADAAKQNVSRILVYKLGSKKTLPPLERAEKVLSPPPLTASAEQVAEGKILYHQTCFACHGDSVVSGGVLPDLRYSNQGVHGLWRQIVLEGLFKSRGMVGFDQILDKKGADAIQAYVIKRAHDLKAQNKEK